MLTTPPGPAAQQAAPGFVGLAVTAVDRLTDDSVAVTFQVPPEHAEAFRFRAGQHLTLRRLQGDRDLRRTYSLCTSAVGGLLRVAVKQLDGGAFSPWVNSGLRIGDEVQALPPAGSFGPHVTADRVRRYALIAAGSGITPILSIAASVLDIEPDSTVVLVYGNRTTRDVMFLEDLSDLKDRFPTRLQVLHAMSREEQESELLSGRLDKARLQRIVVALGLVGEVDEWYLCGPFGMVTNGRQALLDAGVEPSAVHVELFHADAPPLRPKRGAAHTAGTSLVVAELNGRSTTVELARDGPSVLDALLAVRGDTPFACKGGVCGTCRARVTSGSVDMDVNYALEQGELDSGIVLTCQSHPTATKVTLEFL